MGYSMHSLYAGPSSSDSVKQMTIRTLFLFAACSLAALAPAADARPRDREQDEAWRGTQQGRFIPLPMIESRIVPRMRGFQYLGPELDPGAARYRLKFMRGQQVVWIDVDAHTGAIIGKSGY
jgi:hypothetical protein